MDLVNRFKASFRSTFIKIFQLLPKTTPLPPPPPAVAAAEVLEENHPLPAALIADHHYNLDWAMIMIGICLPSAVDIALQSLQTQSQLPTDFHLLCLAIIFSFTFLFLSKFMSSKFPTVGRVLEGLGVLFSVTAIFVAITIPLPLWLKCVTWSLYAIFLIAIIICVITSNSI